MSGRKVGLVVGGLFASAVAVSLTAFAAGGAAVVMPTTDLKWAASGIPGVSTSTVQGDMGKGASHFYLKYAAGFVSPLHHHSADHYVTTVAGNLTLVVDGKEHRLLPGSYFSFNGKAPHVARCVGTTDCVMFIDARDTWDIVPEASPQAKH